MNNAGLSVTLANIALAHLKGNITTDNFTSLRKSLADRIRSELDAARLERPNAFEAALRSRHNGYDPEARASLPDRFPNEPETPENALDELIEEANQMGIIEGRMEAEARLERPAVEWTTEKPTRPGWYWWRERAGAVHRMKRVHSHPTFKGLYVDLHDEPWSVQTASGQWAGPIPEPVTIEPRG